MQDPMRPARQPMGIEIGGQQCSLKEDKTGNPDCGRTAEGGQELLGGDGLHKEKQKRRKKNSAAEENS